MGIGAEIIGGSALTVWGLSGRTRLQRQLRAAGVGEVEPAASDRILVLNADYIFEQRTVNALSSQAACALLCPRDKRICAAVAAAGRWAELRALVAGELGVPPDLPLVEPAQMERFDGRLRKAEPALLEPLTLTNRVELEQRLYGNSYKGVTDFITKFVWPRPAQQVVGWCARAGITPNAVTITSLILVVAAAWLFANGHFWSGLACGWCMTLLDTVDGKLARVTIQASPFGHWLDHGMDIVHPPIWYVLWGQGVAAALPASGIDVALVSLAIVAGYAGGRLLEALFHALGPCSMFAWRPFDAYFRLVTARRNPCLVIMTLALVAGRADWAFVGVMWWTLVSSAIMAVRLAQATWSRWRHGPVTSWLSDPAAASKHPRAYQTFSGTRGAYG